MPTLHIQLLGRFAVQLDSHSVDSLAHQRLQFLLAYLVLHRSAPVLRRRLAAVFWPDSPEGQALTNLRNLLHRLRSALPVADSYIVADGQTVQWRPAGPWQLDVADFEHDLAEAARAADRAASCSALSAAVGRYQGWLLPDCYDDWLIDERERLHQRYHAALLRLVHLLEDRQAYQDAIRYAERLLRDEPLQELHYRLLMRLYALSGDRVGIARVYQACADELQRELDIAPAQETQALYDKLRRTVGQPAPVARAAAPPPLVGHEAAWQDLLNVWHAAAGGQARMALILGEPGIGKSRLAQELLLWAGRQGVVCAAAQCYAAEGALPYAAPAAWLRTDSIRQALPALDPISRQAIVQLLPELHDQEPAPAQRAAPGEPWQRQRFFAALTHATVGNREPRMLVLDDIHWCDRETAEWLHYLLRSAAEAPLLLIGTARPEEILADHPIQPLLASLRRRDQLAVVELSRLDQDATTALITAIIGHKPAPGTGEAIYDASEGVPLFVVELVRSGLLTRQAVVHRHVGEALCPLELTPALIDLLAERLARVSAPACELATVVALAASPAGFDTLACWAGMPEETLLAALEELLRHAILVETQEDRFALSHRSFRSLLLAQLSRPRRRMLEQRLAAVASRERSMRLPT